jgi:acyl carrier protein
MIFNEKFYRDLEVIRELEFGTIAGNEMLDEIEWDSYAAIAFIAMADSDYGVAIPADKLHAAKSVADLLALVLDPKNKRC